MLDGPLDLPVGHLGQALVVPPQQRLALGEVGDGPPLRPRREAWEVVDADLVVGLRRLRRGHVVGLRQAEARLDAEPFRDAQVAHPLGRDAQLRRAAHGFGRLDGPFDDARLAVPDVAELLCQCGLGAQPPRQLDGDAHLPRRRAAAVGDGRGDRELLPRARQAIGQTEVLDDQFRLAVGSLRDAEEVDGHPRLGRVARLEGQQADGPPPVAVPAQIDQVVVHRAIGDDGEAVGVGPRLGVAGERHRRALPRVDRHAKSQEEPRRRLKAHGRRHQPPSRCARPEAQRPAPHIGLLLIILEGPALGISLELPHRLDLRPGRMLHHPHVIDLVEALIAGQIEPQLDDLLLRRPARKHPIHVPPPVAVDPKRRLLPRREAAVMGLERIRPEELRRARMVRPHPRLDPLPVSRGDLERRADEHRVPVDDPRRQAALRHLRVLEMSARQAPALGIAVGLELPGDQGLRLTGADGQASHAQQQDGCGLHQHAPCTVVPASQVATALNSIARDAELR